MKLHRYTKKTIALAVAAVMAAGLAGCRASDEIQKIVYTQDAAEVDDTEVTRRWEQEAEEQDDHSDELQEEEDTEQDNEEETQEDQITADETEEETAPEEADETETPNTEETAQVASAEETGTNQIANDSDEGTGSSQISGHAAGETETSGGEAADATDPDSDAEPSGDGDTSGGQPQDAETPEDGENQPDDSENGDSDSEGNQQDEEGTTSEEGDNSAGEDTEEPRKQIYDTDGNLIALPDSVSTIVAAGEAALITQMLGGEGVLLGSSSDFLGNTLVQSVFADEGIAEVASLWSGDGSSAMSDESFAQLLELNPDCVLEISGETNFSSDQETQLKEAQIYIVTLPALTSSNNIDAAVETVGQLLDDHAVGDTTSVELAEEYAAYEDELVAEVQGKKGTFHKIKDFTSAYVDYFTNITGRISDGDYAMILWDWDDSFYCTYSYNGVDYISQSGGAVTNAQIMENPAGYYLAIAGVMNTFQTQHGTRETVFVPYYMLQESSMTDADQNQDRISAISGFGSSLSLFGGGDGGLGMSYTYYNNHYGTTFTCGSNNYEIREYSMSAALGYTTSSYVSGDYAWLGTERFPYIIAATQEIKSNMEASKNSSTGLYAVRTWGIEIDDTIASIAQSNLYPYTDPKPGQSSLVVNTYTTLRQDYDIVVNPSGCGDWLTGSVESVLESVWISNLYWGNDTYSDADRDAVIEDFYKTFYRHELSSGELGDILDGE